MEESKIMREMQSLLKMKLLYFKAFYDISIQQKKAIAQDDNEKSQIKTAQSINKTEIESLLLKKDNVISKILELERKTESIIKDNLSLESKLADDSTVKSFNQQIKEVIGKIVPIEKEVAATLEKYKNLLKERAGTLRRGRTLITGYGGQKFIRPRFIDYKLQ
tara:strand:- start:8338 stop:8826 length:489 start_codon:yes stop_codon:yes gene_type:complete